MIKLIINPASGQDYPILAVANRVFSEHKIAWEPLVTMQDGDAAKFAENAVATQAEAVMVYGGDGTVVEVAEALYKTNIPLGIIPGGTANVLSKELAIPQDPESALRIFVTGDSEQKAVDMGKMSIYDENNITLKRFILRVTVGMLADTVINTSRERKNSLGNLSYTVSALEQMPAAECIKFKLYMDGVEMDLEGTSLMVTNAGNVGLPGLQFNQHISITDGKLDTILVKGGDIKALLQLFAGAILPNPLPDIEHWHSSKIEIRLQKSRNVLCDDIPFRTNKMVIEIDPQSVLLLVPKEK